MTVTALLIAEALLLALYLFLAVVHYVSRRQREHDLAHYVATSPQQRIAHWLVAGTDADLKLELVYFTSLTVASVAARYIELPPSRFNGLHAIVATVLGFHLRLWLSKWRLRNIVFVKILMVTRLVYFKGVSDAVSIAANLIATIYLAGANPAYALFAFVGFFAQDLSLESRKASRLLQRKLHIFDLEGLPVATERKEQLFQAIHKHSLRSLRALVRSASTDRDRVLLHGFNLLLMDDFVGFRALLQREQDLITRDSDLLFYFGKALYALGDNASARQYLERGCAARSGDRLCSAYYALTLIADGDEAGIREAKAVLEPYYLRPGESKGDMFGLGFYTLALALSTKRLTNSEEERSDFSKAFWCINEALRLNEVLANTPALGVVQRQYFLGNEQVLLDIYGYLLYRMNSLVVAFRVLEDSIRQDDTYPWPYFHLALLYRRVGRHDRAKVILYRIASHERSDTVLRRLCKDQIAALVAMRA